VQDFMKKGPQQFMAEMVSLLQQLASGYGHACQTQQRQQHPQQQLYPSRSSSSSITTTTTIAE
jgi:hypothetical protein